MSKGARQTEYRSVGRKGLELREVQDTSDGLRFVGYASVFNHPYEVMEWDGSQFTETVKPGAFRQTLQHKGGRVPIFGNHDPAKHIGYGLGGSEDARGLLVEGEIMLDFEEGRKHATLMKQAHRIGVPMGLSMGFQAIKDHWADQRSRDLLEVALHHWTPTPIPANDAAAVDSFRAQLCSLVGRGIISADSHIRTLLDDPAGVQQPIEAESLHSIADKLGRLEALLR